MGRKTATILMVTMVLGFSLIFTGVFMNMTEAYALSTPLLKAGFGVNVIGISGLLVFTFKSILTRTAIS